MSGLARARKIIGEAWATAGLTLLLLVLVEGSFELALRLHPAPPSPDPRESADTYGGAGWTHRYYQELEQAQRPRWAPYVYWRRSPYRGEDIHVDDAGLRRTWAAPARGDASPSRLQVFMLGGSAMWGTGARDDFTIPSEVAKKLAEKGVPATVTNFGESGYVTTQEVMTLVLEIRRGHVPDVVVFYDGVNDTFSAYQQRAAGLPQNEENRVEELNSSKPATLAHRRRTVLRESLDDLAVVRFFRGTPKPTGTPIPRAPAPGQAWGAPVADDAALAREVIRAYLANVEIVRLLAAQHHFHALFYWQPTLFQKKRRTPYEEAARREQGAMEPFFERVYAMVATESSLSAGGRFRDLSTLFADAGDPLFVDWCHVGETANTFVAERMTADILAARSEAPATP